MSSYPIWHTEKNKGHFTRKFYVANFDVVADLKNVSKFVEKYYTISSKLINISCKLPL
jgi:hypothetical protein